MSVGLAAVLRDVRSIQRLPDGSPIPAALSHTLLVLATYYPHMWPGQHRLAADLNVSRSTVNKRLRRLEDADLIRRTKRLRGARSTAYWLNMARIRRCGEPPNCVTSAPSAVSPVIQEEQLSKTAPDLEPLPF